MRSPDIKNALVVEVRATVNVGAIREAIARTKLEDAVKVERERDLAEARRLLRKHGEER